jgi:hypothetical protein
VAEAPPDDLPTKRRLLYGKGMETRRAAVAKALIAAGRLAESLEYLERKRERPLLEEARRRAVEAGDAFSLQRSCQLLEAPATPDEWRTLAERAERRERYYDAVNALERAGDAEKAEALRAAKCPDYAPFRPAGK